MLDRKITATILQCISENNATIYQFLVSILQDPQLQEHSIVLHFLDTAVDFLTGLSGHPVMQQPVQDWALAIVNRNHSRSLQSLTSKSHGWHFTALTASVQQIHEFKLEDMAKVIQTAAPGLWKTITSLLSADPKQVRRRKSNDHVSNAAVDVPEENGEEDEADLWVGAEGELENPTDGRTSNNTTRQKMQEQQDAIIALAGVPLPSRTCVADTKFPVPRKRHVSSAS
jgi:hypothetical protein